MFGLEKRVCIFTFFCFSGYGLFLFAVRAQESKYIYPLDGMVMRYGHEVDGMAMVQY